MSVKEYFPGANTPQGFCSCYSHILRPDETKKVVVLKGGPGTGKSSLMKKVAANAIDSGSDVELLHCSSDPDSLDGVCIRESGFLIVDGTSPHIIDPRLPGAVDEIINLGDCWQKDNIRPFKADIEKLSVSISAEFTRAYRYMRSAQALMEQIKSDSHSDNESVFSELDKLQKELDISKVCYGGKERKGFLNAHTHLGEISYAHTFARDAKYVVKVIPDFGGVSERFMKELAHMLLLNGLSLRIFYDSMSADSVPEHIYIENDNVFITTKKTDDRIDNCQKIINFKAGQKSTPLSVQTEYDMHLYDELIRNAVSALKKAKKLHDDLEKYYIPYMNFDMVNVQFEKVIKILNS